MGETSFYVIGGLIAGVFEYHIRELRIWINSCTVFQTERFFQLSIADLHQYNVRPLHYISNPLSP